MWLIIFDAEGKLLIYLLCLVLIRKHDLSVRWETVNAQWCFLADKLGGRIIFRWLRLGIFLDFSFFLLKEILFEFENIHFSWLNYCGHKHLALSDQGVVLIIITLLKYVRIDREEVLQLLVPNLDLPILGRQPYSDKLVIDLVGTVVDKHIEVADIFVVLAANGTLLDCLVGVAFADEDVSLQINASLSFDSVLQQFVVYWWTTSHCSQHSEYVIIRDLLLRRAGDGIVMLVCGQCLEHGLSHFLNLLHFIWSYVMFEHSLGE